MTRDASLTGNEVARAIIAVDEFFYTDDMVDVFQYGIMVTWCEPAMLREWIAVLIDDCASIGIPFDDVHGTVLLSSLYALAAQHEAGVHVIPRPPIDDDTVVIVCHSDGGVHLAIGDGEAWDPTMWHLRFGPRGAA